MEIRLINKILTDPTIRLKSILINNDQSDPDKVDRLIQKLEQRYVACLNREADLSDFPDWVQRIPENAPLFLILDGPIPQKTEDFIFSNIVDRQRPVIVCAALKSLIADPAHLSRLFHANLSDIKV